MIEFFLALSISAYWFALFVGVALLFVIRLAAGLKAKLSGKQMIELLFLPLSLGYYKHFPVERPYRKLYEWTQLIVLGSVLIAAIFVFYTHYA